MLNIQKTKPQRGTVEPILDKVYLKAKADHRRLTEMYDLLGWSDLPEEIKIEINEDVKAFKDELEGFYSSCDPHVKRRRRSIRYWIQSFRDGSCTARTAAQSLRVRSL